ncbi:MAG: DEAD/DEAH box helicase [Candidatus Aenigmatarchaeota archaeon]
MHPVFKLLGSEVGDLASRRFGQPTPVQEDVIPHILDGKDCLVVAETGSGKTEACLLPIFSKWLCQQPKATAILYITPLRALNRDLLKRLLWWGENIGIDISVRHGDTSTYERAMQAENPADMLISTPESLQAILLGKKLRKALENIKWIIIDELHELFPNKRGAQLLIALARLSAFLKQGPQIIALSATLGNPQEAAEWLASPFGKQCNVINTVPARKQKICIEMPRPGPQDVEFAERMATSPELAARLRRIKEIFSEKRSLLIFTNTREWAEILASRLRAAGLALDIHHSSLSREARIKAENELKEGNIKAIVCTSSLELGIDIGHIDFILQYGSPRQVGKLIQRIGRSGHRIDKIAEGIILTTDIDDMLEARAIVSLAEKGWTEPIRPYNKPLDVLCHQIAGILLERYKIRANDVYNLFKKTKTFEGLSWEEFIEMCNFMQKLGYLWIDSIGDDFLLKRRKATFGYYYSNLSTIPDVKNYRVIDIVSQQPIGTLDAEFVALHGNPDQVIIFKGRSWRIIEVGERILVEPTDDITGAIPAWEGELIPVPKEVAENVGKLRKEIKMDGQPIVPDNETVLFEWGKERVQGLGPSINYAIIHICSGSQANEAIGQALAYKLSQRFGSVALRTDPYRILIRWSGGSWRDAYEAFLDIKEGGNLKEILTEALPHTELFAWRFYQVCQRFGIISRDAQLSKFYLKKLMESYRDSPAWRETMNEIEQGKIDITGAAEVLTKIKRIEVIEGLTALGRAIAHKGFELVGLARPEHEIFSAFKERLLATKIGLVCCYCAKWARVTEVREIPELICPVCSSKLIAVVPWRRVDEAKKLIEAANKKKRMKKAEEERVERILAGAYLVISHGRDAVLCLAGHGIGPQTASRILSTMPKDDELFRAILKAEKEFLRTRVYWR